MGQKVTYLDLSKVLLHGRAQRTRWPMVEVTGSLSGTDVQLMDSQVT